MHVVWPSEEKKVEEMEEGKVVYYIDEGRIYSGQVTDVEKSGEEFVFSIDSYGDCSGQHRISSAQIGITVFLSKEEAESAVGGEQESYREEST